MARKTNSDLLRCALAVACSLSLALALGCSGATANTVEGRRSLFADQSRDRDSPAGIAQTTSATTSGNQSTSMTLYKEPSGWIVNILKELFSDIDWQAIENARVQIEKFIHKVDRIVGSFRTIISKASGGGGISSSTTAASERSPEGRWWGGGDKKPAAAADATNVKEMLERVACYVGYVRLMNLSNEALAELDASKVVSSLFGNAGGGARRNSSMWSWLG